MDGAVAVPVRTHDGWTSRADLITAAERANGTLAPVPVVLLHGLSQQRHFWGPVVRRMGTRPVLVIDQRGHGESDAPADADFSLDACARDVVMAMDAAGVARAVIVGHSWGAAVALRVAALHPDRASSAVLIDGGLWTPADLGDRASVRERLRPPALGVSPDVLWGWFAEGDFAPWWNPEIQDALAPTFVADEDGLLRTRIGMDRHMAVLDGLLDARPDIDLAATATSRLPLWVVSCEPRPTSAQDAVPGDPLTTAWARARREAVESTLSLPHVTTLRWTGALHDVPLQWPGLVAGLIDQVAEGGR